MGIPRRIIAIFLSLIRRFVRSLRRAPLAFLLLAATLAATFFGWQYSRDVAERLAFAKFNEEMKGVESGIISELGIYMHELYGARGFFAGSDNVTRVQWSRFTAREISNFFPGLFAIGFAERVVEKDRGSFVASVRSDTSVRPGGYPDFSIHPGSRGVAMAVKYVSPEGSNLDRLGLDLWADGARSDALRRAIKTGRATATAPVWYPLHGTDAATVEIYLPVYSKATPQSASIGEEPQLEGVVFLLIDPAELMSGIYRDRGGAYSIDVEIYDGEALAPSNRLYDRVPEDGNRVLSSKSRFTAHRILGVADRTWSVRYAGKPGKWGLQESVPLIVLLAGLGLSILLFGVLHSLAASQATALKLAELAALVESSGDAVLAISPAGFIQSWNPAAQRIYGYAADEIIGKPISALVPPESASDAAQILERVRMEGQIPYYQTQRLRKDGLRILVSATVSPVRDSDGKIKGIMTIDRDITHLVEVQRQLEQSKEFYLTLFEHFPAMIWRSRYDSGRDYFNKTWTAFTGRGTDFEKNDQWKASLHPDDIGRYLDAYNTAHREHKAFEIEYRHRRHDGEYRWLSDHGIPFNGLDGRFSGFIGFSLDVTDRKKVDADLRHNLDLLSSIIENIPDMIFLKEAGELRFELFNKAGEELIGFSRDEMIGKNDYDFFPKDQADFFTRKDRQALLGKMPLDIPEETVQTRFKGRRILHTKKVPIASADPARPAHLLGISEDITDRKNAEAALRESEQRLRSILDESTAVVYLKDTDGHYLFVNRRFEKLFGVTRDSLAGKSDYDLFPKKFADAFHRNDVKVLSDGGPHEFEEIVEQEGKTHTYISVKFPLLNLEGKAYALCGISTDISERKHAEEMLRKANQELTSNEKKLRKVLAETAAAHEELKNTQSQLIRMEKFAALGKMAGIVSHEFRNQLGVIRNAAYFIKTRLHAPEEKVADHLRILEKEIEETDRIIENILSFARNNKPSLKKTDIAKLLETSIRRADLPSKIRLDLHVPAGLAPIEADEVLLGRVFLNIILNAAQAISGPGRIVIRATAVDRSVELQFEDTGSGIEERDLKRMFDPLFSTKIHGTGLGLATSKVLVEAHGGTIEVQSAAGVGTTVILRLPVTPTV